MTIASIDSEIAQARAEFTRLNAGRHQQGFWRELPTETERRIVELAEHIEKLHQTKNALTVEAMLLIIPRLENNGSAGKAVDQ